MAEQLAGTRLTDDETRLAAYLIRCGAAAIERTYGSLPPAVAVLRDQLDMFARRIAFTQASSEDEHANLIEDDDRAVSGPQIGTAAAAGRLGVSAQAVRRMCRHGVLIATRPAGRDAWQIDSWSLEQLAARRRKEAS